MLPILSIEARSKPKPYARIRDLSHPFVIGKKDASTAHVQFQFGKGCSIGRSHGLPAGMLSASCNDPAWAVVF